MSELIYSIRDIFGSDGSTACLPQSNCKAFWIPAYQRGYKWGADGENESTQPVDQLLRDLKRAWQSGAKEYLLQAITVKKVKDETQGWVLEVIDGQQRLTTLFILLHALERWLGGGTGLNIATGKLHYSVRHEGTDLDKLVTEWIKIDTPMTRTFAEWEAFQKAGDEQHQDRAYLRRAALRCLYEFRPANDKDEGAVAKFQRYLLENVKLLVNLVEPHIQGEVIFAALNSNRVPLTECDLIKGVLLTRVARRPRAGRSRGYRELLELRIQLGRQWDKIHHWANREDIRSFYFSLTADVTGSDGMMRLLQLATLQTSQDPHPSRAGKTSAPRRLFTHIFELPDPGIIFDQLIDTHARLQDWHDTEATYHLLGYCLTDKNQAERTLLLVKLLLCETKTEAREELLKLRKKMLIEPFKEWNIEALSYSEHPAPLKNIFLALSVFADGHHGRFNFFAYADEDWSLEHIFPQTPFGKGAKPSETQKQVALDLMAGSADLLGADKANEISQLRKSSDFADDLEKILASIPILHRAGNLCLLRCEDNSSMGCGMFHDKRRIIRERIAKGSFVPRHTYEVFSKMIAKSDEDSTVWTRLDIDGHACVIKERIGKLINETV